MSKHRARARDNTGVYPLMYFIEGKMVSETRYRAFLKSQGLIDCEIDKLLEDFRVAVCMDDDE